jgi:hypothetical protein
MAGTRLFLVHARAFPGAYSDHKTKNHKLCFKNIGDEASIAAEWRGMLQGEGGEEISTVKDRLWRELGATLLPVNVLCTRERAQKFGERKKNRTIKR